VLIEGGASTVSAFIEARAIDRLHVLVAPLILGSGKPGLELSPVPCLADALRPKTQPYQLAGGDVLFDCDMRAAGD
jgi:riboflavin biosynthesis pyrimidine reductase